MAEDCEDVGSGSRITAKGVHVKVSDSGGDPTCSMDSVVYKYCDDWSTDGSVSEDISDSDSSSGSCISSGRDWRASADKNIKGIMSAEQNRIDKVLKVLETKRAARWEWEASVKSLKAKIAESFDAAERKLKEQYDEIQSELALSRRSEAEHKGAESKDHVDREKKDIPDSDVHLSDESPCVAAPSVSKCDVDEQAQLQTCKVEVCADEEWDQQRSTIQDRNAEVQELRDERIFVTQKTEQVPELHMKSQLERKVLKSKDRDKCQGLVRGEGLIMKDRRCKWKERSPQEPSKTWSEEDGNSCDGEKLKNSNAGRKAKDKRERRGQCWIPWRKGLGSRRLWSPSVSQNRSEDLRQWSGTSNWKQKEQTWRILRCSA